MLAKGDATTHGQDSPAKLRLGLLNITGHYNKEWARQALYEQDLDYMILTETWHKCERDLPKETIASCMNSSRDPNLNPTAGIAIIANRNKIKGRPKIEIIRKDEENGLFLIVKIRGYPTIAAFYLPPSMDDEAATALLRDCVTPLSIEPLIVLGDFNARNAARTKDHATNARGRLLFELLEGTGLTYKPPDRGLWTFLNQGGRSVIDLIFSNTETQNITAHEDLHVGPTNHALVSLEIQGTEQRMSVPSHRETTTIFKLGRLKEPAYRDRYAQRIEENSGPILRQMQTLLEQHNTSIDQETLDQLDWKITKIFMDNAREVLGTTSSTLHPSKIEPITPHLARLKAIGKLVYSQWYKYKTNDLNNLRHRFEQEIAKERWNIKKENYNKYLEKMEKLPPSIAIKKLSKMTRVSSRKTALSSSPEDMEESALHFEATFNNQWKTELTQNRTQEQSVPTKEPLEAEILALIMSLPIGKAPGPSSLPNELIKSTAQAACKLLTPLFQLITRHRIVPSSWRQARIIPIHKKGDPSRISNYRPISLTESVRKLFEKYLYAQITEKMAPLSITQGGFRPQRGTLDQILALHLSITRARDAGKPVYLAFLDITKAYDSVPREQLWTRCREMNLDPGLIEILMGLFENVESKVVINDCPSRPIRHRDGLLQGSILSPLLYSIFIDTLPGKIIEWRKNTSFHNETPFLFLYADDIAILATSKLEMQGLLETCEAHSIDNNYRFNTSKSFCITPEPTKFQLYNQDLQESNSFTYLGVPVSEQGIDPEEYITSTSNRAKKKFDAMRHLGLFHNGLSLSSSVRVLKAFIRPIWEYALSILNITKGQIKPLELTQKQILSSIIGISPKGTGTDRLALVTGMNSVWARKTDLRHEFIKRTAPKTRNPKEFLIGSSISQIIISRTQDRFSKAIKRICNNVPDPPRQCKNELEAVGPTLSERCNINFGPTSRVMKILRGTKCDKETRRTLTLWLLNRRGLFSTTCTRCNTGLNQSHIARCGNLYDELLSKRILPQESLPGLPKQLPSAILEQSNKMKTLPNILDTLKWVARAIQKATIMVTT